MSNDVKNSSDRRRPSAPATREQIRAKRTSALSLDVERSFGTPGTPPEGSDPYNTSGSFDRTKNWSRVGKR
ncbi:MAG TPA: hypothetical protein VKP66_15945 [Steroidobacteraceae bacterium]|nr:hypothetical protein [Steroidobacteraceae bacterium]